MSVAWEKVVMWILILIVMFVLLAFMFVQLRDNPESIVGRLFAVLKSANT